jgi:hypothetical protein
MSLAIGKQKFTLTMSWYSKDSLSEEGINDQTFVSLFSSTQHTHLRNWLATSKFGLVKLGQPLNSHGMWLNGEQNKASVEPSVTMNLSGDEKDIKNMARTAAIEFEQESVQVIVSDGFNLLDKQIVYRISDGEKIHVLNKLEQCGIPGATIVGNEMFINLKRVEEKVFERRIRQIMGGPVRARRIRILELNK